MYKLLLSFLFLLAPFILPAQSPSATAKQAYREAWKALDHNNFAQAKSLLLQAAKDPLLRNDAYATLIILDDYLGQERDVIKNYHDPILQMSDPENYFYALWFDEACLGNYGKLDSVHMDHIRYIQSHKDLFNGSLQAAAWYFRSFHELTMWNMPQSLRDAAQIKAITRWSVTGPFENAVGSGFDRNYGPLDHPMDTAAFKSFVGAKIKWFVPDHMENASWVFVKTAFPDTKGLVYAQSFVKSGEDKSCVLCVGGAGSLKVWVNDKLLLSETEEKVTELDTYKVSCRLNKGYNRVLVQVGYADTQLPNFIVRFTDDSYHPVPGLVAEPLYHPYQKDNSSSKPEEIRLFAERFFNEKVTDDSANPVNYLLLSKVYLRNQKGYQSQRLLTPLLKQHPDNVLILFQYLLSLQTENNQTGKMEYLEKIKALDPKGFLSRYNKMSQQEANSNYKSALDSLDEIDQLVGPDPSLLIERIKLTAYTGDLPALLALIKKGLASYPDNPVFSTLLYAYYKKAANNPSEALKALEDYNDRLFNYQVAHQLSQEYIAQGQIEKGMNLLKKLVNLHPETTEIYNSIAVNYYQQNEMDSAIAYIQAVVKNAPYNSQPYVDLATCYLQQNDTAAAISDLNRALEYNPTLFTSREKLRTLMKKPALSDYFPRVNAETEVTNALAHPYDSLHHYYYIFDIKNTIIYAEGASEQESKTAIYIRDEKGVSRFKDLYIPYNSNFQELTILKAQVMKSNGSVVPAETNNNEIVFSKIEPGDAIFYQYKLRNYGVGRIGREFWDQFYFSAAVPTHLAQCNVLIADKMPIYYRWSAGGDLKPNISTHDGFKLYSWEMDQIPALKEEYLMPLAVDVGKVLHLSTIPSWNFIAAWYSDITREQSASSLEIEELLQELFPQGTAHLSDMDKARTIYNYIVQHIAYSSVAFLQSAYVPQKAGRTLITRLGDCKDVATLFVALARKAGIDANLVLVNTRDNGQHAMQLPSLEFNHCIATFRSEGQQYYLELTDQNLPFLALPGNVCEAQALPIPYNSQGRIAQITRLNPVNKKADRVVRNISITLSGNDLTAHSDLCVSGAISANFRDNYKNELAADIKESMKQQLSQLFKKSVTLDDIRFSGLDQLGDSIHEAVEFSLDNEVITVGKMHVWKPIFIDVVASPDLFTVSDRKYPITYWQYENADEYKTTVEVNLPGELAFKEIPGDVDYSFDQMKYHLSYKKVSPHKVVIERSFVTRPWENIPAAEYKKMESFFRHITDAESRYLSF